METNEPVGGVSAGSPQGADALAEQLGLFLDARPLAGYPEILSQLVGAIVEAAALGAGSRVYKPLSGCLSAEHGELSEHEVCVCVCACVSLFQSRGARSAPRKKKLSPALGRQLPHYFKTLSRK